MSKRLVAAVAACVVLAGCSAATDENGTVDASESDPVADWDTVKKVMDSE